MTKSNRLFKESGKAHGTVVLNWHGNPKEEFTLFAGGFHKVAQVSVSALKQNPRFGLHGVPLDDFQAYPIVFLYRHCLELYMKAIILAGSGMVRLRGGKGYEENRLRRTHGLEELSGGVEEIFDAYRWDWNLGSHFRTLSDFKAIISEFQNVDAQSSSFRYPIDTKGKASLESRFRFNLFEFSEMLDALFAVLRGLAYAAQEELHMEYAARAEAREAEMENSNEPDD